jgi:hypothetical protein
MVVHQVTWEVVDVVKNTEVDVAKDMDADE